MNEIKCNKCEFLKTLLNTKRITVKMICLKFNVQLEQDAYLPVAYKCYQCRNGELK